MQTFESTWVNFLQYNKLTNFGKMTDERAWKNNSNTSGVCGKQQLDFEASEEDNYIRSEK